MSLSDLELKYPFAPSSRKFFETIPVEEGLSSGEVLGQTEVRLMSALGRKRYEPHISELVEFSSFFAAALIASQDGFLIAKFSKRESEMAKSFFSGEGTNKPVVMRECFGHSPVLSERDGRSVTYSLPVENYLGLATRFELTRSPRWKLSRQALMKGLVLFSDPLLNDFFADCAQGAISEGVKNLRRGAFPRQLLNVKASVMRFVPLQKPKAGKGYLYVEDLLKHPVSDGRHRLVWMVLAPYLINIRKLEESEAIERIRAFVSVAGETRDMKRFVEYNVRRARRNGLLPPTLSTLKTEHPDVYSLLPKEILVAETAKAKGNH